ncbi:MAG: TRAP transporter substrate-binding protein DctP [Eubacteriales bacterium]|nr:TRAP transporter substrate-binding protein DctP [Eubacteriales bacterium]
MKKSKKISIVILSIVMVMGMTFGISGCGSTNESSDETFDLTMTVHSASTTAYAKALDEWAAEMSEKSDGRLNIDISYGGTIATAENTVDVTIDGGADLCWSTVPLNNSKFKYINVFSCFGEDITNSMSATKALVDLVKNNKDIAGEYEKLGLKLVGIHALTPNALCSVDKKFQSTEDFNGVSVMAISSANIAVLEGLGAAPQGIVTTDLYENFSKNVSDASLVDASLYESTSSYEQVNYWCTYNFSTCVSFIAMNQGVYDSLPSDLREIIDSSFDDLSYSCAEYVNSNFQKFVGKIRESGIEMYDISDNLLVDVEDLINTEVYGPWEKMCKEDGVDAAAITDSIEKSLKAGNKEYGEEYTWYK